MAIENNGVIYYKLNPEYHYEGDYTKNCGLSGGEIDGNFNFLRGYDISSFEIDDKKEKLTITRLNGETMIVNIKTDFVGYNFDYDTKNGILTIVPPIGDAIEIEGFLTEQEFNAYTDGSLNGNGSKNNPLGISNTLRTGMYRPAKAIVDELPQTGLSKNDRYVTKEKSSKYGLLYPLEGVKKLAFRLKEIDSEWRVPTKSDWDTLLNLVEICEEDKTHGSTIINTFLGKNAGSVLKTITAWEPFYRKLEKDEVVLEGERYSKNENGEYVSDVNGEYVKCFYSEDKHNFNIYPVGFGGRQGIENIEGFGKWAAYWTSTESEEQGDMYVKVFSHEERGVEQTTWGNGCHLSLRLVKEYNGNNYAEIEEIDGYDITTQLFKTNDTTAKTLIWTDENIGFADSQYLGVESKEWEEHVQNEYKYFINEWDGEKWVKNLIEEGESLVILNVDGIELHEWRIISGDLVDTLTNISGDINNGLVGVNKKIEELGVKVATNKTSIENINKKIGFKNDITDNTIYGYVNVNIKQILGDNPISGMSNITEIGNTITKNKSLIGTLSNRIDTTDSNLQEVIKYCDEKDIEVKEHAEGVAETAELNSKQYADGIYSKLKLSAPFNDILIEETEDEGTKIKLNVDEKTILRNDKNGILSVNPDAFMKYVGNEPIVIEDAENDVKNVFLKVSENDEVLTITDGLKVNLSLKYENNEIQLLGKKNVLSTIDASDFIKDGMLEGVELIEKNGEPVIVFTFNSISGKGNIEINVKDLMVIYQAGNGLELGDDNITFNIKLDEQNEGEYFTVSNNGLKFTGLNDVNRKIDAIEELLGGDVDTSITERLSLVEENVETNIDAIEGLTETTTSNSEAITQLQNKITELEATIATQQTQIEQLLEAFNNIVIPEVNIDEIRKSIINEEVLTTNGDIKLTFTEEGKVEFGFGDDAVFIAEP